MERGRGKAKQYKVERETENKMLELKKKENKRE